MSGVTVRPSIAPYLRDLVLEPISRHPLVLPAATGQAVLDAPIPQRRAGLPLGPGEQPFVSIAVLTYNNLICTRLCLESVLAHTDDPSYELLVVDNASDDQTVSYLRSLQEKHDHIRLIENKENRGFAAGNNQALQASRGDVLVFLNNDTIVPPGWLKRIASHLLMPEVGLVGVVTNRIPNEAQIATQYRTYGEMVNAAIENARVHDGELRDIRTAAMFCAAMRRDTFLRVGLLDEQYEVGLLEDDDYSVRVRALGYRVVCARDTFVHHFDKASFGELVASGAYAQRLAANRRRFEAKWQVRWEPYDRRTNDAYECEIQSLRQLVARHVFPDSTVLVVSRGDEELLRLGARRAWHFPRAQDGQYVGYHPASSRAAIEHLNDLIREGATHLVIPNASRWWLDFYKDFAEYLGLCGRVRADDPAALILEFPPQSSR